MQQQASLGLRIAIVIGIAILFPATVYYGVSTVYEQPQMPPYQTADENVTAEEKQAFNEQRETRMAVYEEEQKAFDLRYFWIAVPLGFLTICAGFFRGLMDVGTGLGSGLIISTI